MTRSYDEIIAARRARMSPEDVEAQAVFEKAHNIAMQVIELREQHGLTQAELAAQCGKAKPTSAASNAARRAQPPAPCNASPTRCRPICAWSSAPHS